MSQKAIPIEHPLQRCVSALEGVVDEASGSDPIYLTTDAKASVLVDLSRVISRLEGLRLQVLAAAGDVAEEGVRGRRASGCRGRLRSIRPRDGGCRRSPTR